MNPYNFVRRDIVRLRNREKYEVLRLDDGKCDVFWIESMSSDTVRLDHIFEPIPIYEIEPLPIDGKSDKPIYMDVVIAASTVGEGDDVPVRTIDKTYYKDALKRVFDDQGKTLYDELLQKDFQYVHEVQHWLRKGGPIDLRIDEGALMQAYIADHKIMTEDDYMRLAVDVMKESKQERRNDTKISPLVGAVLVKPNGEVVTAYRSELREGDHAEFTLIERKCQDQNLAGSTLYATLEPCAPGARHFPKLSCAERIVNARIATVYIGIEDPDYTVAGKGRKYLQDCGVNVQSFTKDLQDEITEVNAEFLEQARQRSRLAKEKPSEIVLSSKENIEQRVDFSDLREDLLGKYLEFLGIKEDIRSGYATRVFMQAGMLGLDGDTITPTGLGMLLFGKRPEVMYPCSQVRATFAPEGRQESIETFKGPLLEMPEDIEKWFKDVIGSQIDRSHAKREVVYDYPLNVLREIVINAILHRDYDIEGANTQIVVTEDKIVIKSPGLPVKPLTIQQMQNFSAPTLSRNPKIINIFDVFDLAEQRGLGFKTVRELPEKYNIPLPTVTIEEPYIVITLPRTYKQADENLSERERQGLDYIRLYGPVSRKQYEERFGLSVKTASRDIDTLEAEGYIEKKGTGKNVVYVCK